MDTERTPETERLYNQGIAYMRDGRWQEAVAALTQLRAMTGAYPDIDALIDDAQLKLEVELLGAPAAARPPRRRLSPRLLWGGLAIFLLAGGITTYLMLQPRQPATVVIQPTTSNVTRPTLAASSTPTSIPATATPLPTETPIPTVTPVPVPGILGVRVAEGRQITRTIDNLALILDASGSMSGLINGQEKIDIAHQALAALVDRLPDTANVALRAYGHRTRSCTDSELIQPLSPLQREQLIQQINAIRPVARSLTPIAFSLEAIGVDLTGVDEDVLVVLVSDGDETCDGDPVAAAKALHEADPRLRVSVIGFDIAEQEARARLEAIAAAGGGVYFNAGDAAQLADALEEAVALTYRVVDAQGVEVYQGSIGSTTTLPAGLYRVEIGGDAQLTIDNVPVGGAVPTFVELREENGKLIPDIVSDAVPSP